MNNTLEFIGKRFEVDVASPVVRITQINRTIIAGVFNELGFKQGAEIGVAEGTYSKILFDSIPGLKLNLIDIWKTYPGYSEYTDPEQMYKDAQERLKNYNSVFIRKFSMDAVQGFTNNSLDFVFIDGGHDFKNVACDICEWSKKVKVGGIVFGHDYKFHQAYVQKTRHGHTKQRYAIEVKIVVDAYREARGIKPFFDIHQQISDPTFGPDNPCWMFVRQEGDNV
ncbi:hypothetical protein A2803_05290 [Candidatus Woesebacteria bacterium RIFCSPHIGHO2_01_FULL_44_21]|uniref:Methyltransferase domain-containing protein n=1 Tax=Candidatus Woesebacteria bacterium RIFCSPHIGHO2_01_FULL_44_21 TaxID=1802503 RepID=A0A1F7YWA6_9BACT|nr:MAG: hypothetical protein A2803_05290 [Candidatus Woesebacteria bacterium RIFCSPHIGHO2_01_FULL_44_21]OGM69068.1 MAG: hypothetical protein A2897_04525 [Candidatus Woesebacteria bacterium RIFCSPLOWO2_01_FULL_44_24b]